MDNHAVPRQITTFEFKLLGFFTVKQGIYLAITTAATVIMYFAIPVPFLNFILAALVATFGATFTLLKYNDRSMDVWIKNIVMSLLHPSQYFFHKDNEAPDFLKGVIVVNDIQAATHIDASQKLNKYMTQTGQAAAASTDTQNMNALIHSTSATAAPPSMTTINAPSISPTENIAPPSSSPGNTLTNSPFLSGLIKNSKDAPLPNIMVYVNSEAGQLARILKSNHNGVFATFHPLPSGNYVLSPKDLGGTYFFDTINIAVNGPIKEPIQLFSKELL